MKHRPIIFLDLDGVVVDFLGGVCKRFNRDLSSLPTGIYDLPTLLGLPWATVDHEVNDYQFWRNLNALPKAKEILELLRTVGDVVILSSPWPQSWASYKAKLDWCEEVLGVPHSDVILSPMKHLLAGPGRLLVDDCLGNCNKWSEQGGYAIHMPCHHNADHLMMIGHDPLCHLAFSLERMIWHIDETERRSKISHRN